MGYFLWRIPKSLPIWLRQARCALLLQFILGCGLGDLDFPDLLMTAGRDSGE
jgi:hypothetical protein